MTENFHRLSSPIPINIFFVVQDTGRNQERRTRKAYLTRHSDIEAVFWSSIPDGFHTTVHMFLGRDPRIYYLQS